MSKKDFSQDSQDVLNSMFSFTTIKKAEVQEVKNNTETKKIEKETPIKNEKKESANNVVQEPIREKETKKIEINNSEKTPKIFSKDYRYSFYSDLVTHEFLDNIPWIRRTKNVASYLNSLIKDDLTKVLNIDSNSSDEEIEKAWNKYKQENNL